MSSGGVSASTPGAARFEIPLRFGSADLDALGHVNNAVYLRWVQDAATAHWRHLAPAQIVREIAWVVLRHEIDYLQPVLTGQEVRAETWVGVASGLSFERHTEILRIPDGKLAARARTLWCPVDPVTGRPRRIPAEIRALVSVGTPPAA